MGSQREQMSLIHRDIPKNETYCITIFLKNDSSIRTLGVHNLWIPNDKGEAIS